MRIQTNYFTRISKSLRYIIETEYYPSKIFINPSPHGRAPDRELNANVWRQTYASLLRDARLHLAHQTHVSGQQPTSSWGESS